ncbi:shikimate kinase [Niallia sp.]|uniref:shikimate kinase n=1 Tax=Niallia sp. TaxID=2837523 RepID=UPI0028988D36|nr:shikimate kinase [Niallia sp.]
MLQSEKSIVLIGFMGVGKTTIGNALAKKLQQEFIDADQQLEKKYNMKITEIFRNYGEAFFRKKEKEMIIALSKQKQQVISLGGGAFLQEDIRKVCLDKCIVLYLDMSFEAWKERIPFIIDSRPVLQGKSEEAIKELFNERKKIYANHHLKVKMDGTELEEIVDSIIHSLNLIIKE